jgi:hypothetical protein
MFLIPIILLLGIGGGAAWYFTMGPGKQAAAGSRQITLDAGLPDADKQAVIAAIMTATDPTQTDALSTKYAQYPWASYELKYKSWQLRGSQGTPPAQPTTGGQPTPVPAPAPAQGSAPAHAMPPPGVITPPGGGPAPAPAGVSSPIPAGYDFVAAASVSGAWQNDHTYVKAYQSALTFLAQQMGQPSWNPNGVDGNYGPNTAAAVKAFQSAHGISPVDGEAGKVTATAILNAVNAAVTQASGMGVSPAAVAMAAMAHAGGDMMSGYQQFTTERQDELTGAPSISGPRGERVVIDASKTEIRGSGRDRTGRGEMSGQMGEEGGEMTGKAVEHIAAEAVVQAAAVASPGIPPPRPRGGWYVLIRDGDKIWPRKLVEIGTGVHRGVAGALRHLVDLNPQLSPGGIIRQFVPGDEVNIPSDWASNLKAKGFDVQVDSVEQAQAAMAAGA